MLRMTGEELEQLSKSLRQRAPHEAAGLIGTKSDAEALAALQPVHALIIQQILRELDDQRRCELLAAAPVEKAREWMSTPSYPEDSVGSLMEPPVAVFRPDMTVRETIDGLRKLTKRAFITYGYVTDDTNRLIGVLVMRDLMLAAPDDKLSDVMYTNLFWLEPNMALTDAMKSTLNWHFPVYPVCDEEGRLIGLVRGQSLFEARAIELSAQPGAMVGVAEEVRLTTGLKRSLWMRHPLLQFHLWTAFLSAIVIGLFGSSLNGLFIIAAFFPVVAAQGGITGCQSLAVTLRGLTLGEMKHGQETRLLAKEAALGLINGILVGFFAALAFVIYAQWTHQAHAWRLGGCLWLAMASSCMVSGVLGVVIPLVLRKMSFDPATASIIVLTALTDALGLGIFLAVVKWLVLG